MQGNRTRGDLNRPGGKLLPPPAGTPSTACGRSPSLEEGGLGGRETGEWKAREDAFHRLGRTPSTACGRFPSLEEGGLEEGDGGTEETGGSFYRLGRTPSTACGRSPSLEEGGLGEGDGGTEGAGGCLQPAGGWRRMRVKKDDVAGGEPAKPIYGIDGVHTKMRK